MHFGKLSGGQSAGVASVVRIPVVIITALLSVFEQKKGAIRTLPAPITGPAVVCFCQMEHTKNNNKKKNIQPV